MSDARGVGRTRPRGAAKIKVHASTAQVKHHAGVASSPKSTVLPKLKVASSNNHCEQVASTPPFSPRAREIPVVLPAAPHSISPAPVRPMARPAPPAVSMTTTMDATGPSIAKTAWNTPRSPVPETNESPSSKSSSTSALDAFFHVDGSSVRTPTRLLSIEESLFTAEQLYQIDWAKLQADADKFLEITATACQHIDGIQSDLPAIASVSSDTKGALTNLSKEIDSLHGHHDVQKKKMLQIFRAKLAEHNIEREALMTTHVAQINALTDAHEAEIELMKVDYQRQIQEIEERSTAAESEWLREIEELKLKMANEVQTLNENATAEREQLESRLQKELTDLRSRSDAELTDLRNSAETAYQELLTSSQQEINELKSSSAKEIERLLEVSSSSLAEVTEKLTSELAETQEQASRTISDLKNEQARELDRLQRQSSEDMRLLNQHHADELCHLRDERDREVRNLQNELLVTRKTHATEVEQLLARSTAQLSATTATLMGENNILVERHELQVSALRSDHAKKVSEIVASFDAQLDSLKHAHADQILNLENDASSAREMMVQQYESELRTMKEESQREKDRLVLRYESDLDFLRRSTAESIDAIATEREEAIQQLREVHAARVLALETNMRETEKRQTDVITHLEEELDDKMARIVELEDIEESLRCQNALSREQAKEQICCWSMRVEEMEVMIVQLERENSVKSATIESLKRDLRVSEDGNQTKSNTLLELTFVIKSRDEEIGRLHAALLDTIQNVNSKTEILELTAETLSSRSKELEDTRAALRMESGRLSRVEEDVQLKMGMLEDSELKIENMRLQLETMRLEMKRLQMDMRLQHEHSAGEMELKQGEIRRLHAAQNELKQKNDIHQETIVRLEGSLAASERQADEIRRRMELMKVETAQYLDDARKLGDELLEKDKQNTVATKEAQGLHNDKVKLQIQLNNAFTLVQTQRENLERYTMLVEDIHCQYQRRMEMTAAEKDARLRHEKHLLMLEISTLKDTLRRYEDVEAKLFESQAAHELLHGRNGELADEKAQLEARIKILEEEAARQESERVVTAGEVQQQVQRLEEQLGERADRVGDLERVVLEMQQELRDRNEQVAAVSSDASSLVRLLQEKDDAISAAERRLDTALAENLSASQEIASLRDEVVNFEQLCREKDEEICTLEKAFHSESTVHLRDVKDSEDQLRDLEAALAKERSEKTIQSQAHQEANLQIQFLVATLKEVDELIKKVQGEKALQGQAYQEANSQIEYLVSTLKSAEDQLAKVQAEKATQAQAHQEANFQIQYLVHVLKSAEDALVVTSNSLEHIKSEKALQARAHEEANFQIQYLVAALKDEAESITVVSRKLQEATMALEEKERGVADKIAASVAAAFDAHREEVAVSNQEKETLAKTHAEQLRQLEELKKQELDLLREELTAASQEAIATAKHSFDEEMATLRAEHTRSVANVQEAYRVALAEAEEADKKWSEARSQCDALTQREAELQQRLSETERSLSESQEVLRVRKVTIENVKREMALLMEMQKQTTGASDGDGTNASSISSGRSLESTLQLLKQQVETFVNEEFHVEVAEVNLQTEDDLLNQLKDSMRMRYCLSVIGSSRLLSVEDVCASLQALRQVARVAVGDGELSADKLSVIPDAVTTQFHDHATLVQKLQAAFDFEEENSVLDILEVHGPVFAELKKHVPIEKGESKHASRVTALLSCLADYRAIKNSSDSLVETARSALQSNEIASINELLPLLSEAAFLRRRIEAYRDGVVSAEIGNDVSEPMSNFLLTNEASVLLSERHLLVAELVGALEWQMSTPPLGQCVHIVDAVRELMQVVHAFESLSARDRDDMSESSISERAQAIISFIEELRLVTKFAQNIIDEEADAIAPSVADRSHSSSSSSLLSLRGVLTRTPTPLDELQVDVANDTPRSASAVSLIELEAGDGRSSPIEALEPGLILSGDALAPTENTDHLRPNLSGALSESLLDISLVMNDHHRILSEAAHWVGKARSMSPRNTQKPSSHDVFSSSSSDFAAELSQLVRDHCSILSLSRKLFRLHDPRQDLPSVLQCLAVLSRLSKRLGFFDLSIRTSDSSESLQSNTESDRNERGESVRQHEKLKASLSVFASMEEIARHLQDYDGFLARMISMHFGQDVTGRSIDNIDTLSTAIGERLALVDHLSTSLGIANAVNDLPVFIESIQSLVASSIADRDDCALETDTRRAETILTTGKALDDRKSLQRLLDRMRETLPFSSTAESPDELMEQLNETLSQCDTLIQDKENAWKMVESLTEQLAQMDKQSAEEETILDEISNEHVGMSRLERLTELGKKVAMLHKDNQAMRASIEEELVLLADAWPPENASDDQESDKLDGRVDAVRKVLEAKTILAQTTIDLQTRFREAESEFKSKLRDVETQLRDNEADFVSKFREEEEKRHAVEKELTARLRDVETDFETRIRENESSFEAKLRDSESTFETKLQEAEIDFGVKLQETVSDLEAKFQEAESLFAAEKRKLLDAVENERQFLSDHGIEWAPNEPRLAIYQQLLNACNNHNRRDQRLQRELQEESALLKACGMGLATAEDEIHKSRLAIYNKLFEGQRLLIDEKMDREISDQQELVRLQAEGVEVSDRGAVVTRLIDLARQVKQLLHDEATQLIRQKQLFADETAFLEAHDVNMADLSHSDSRIPIYELLFQHVEAAKQALIAWDGSPHGDAMGCKQADALRTTDRQKLEEQYAEATANAVATALEKQAQQLDFRRAALAAGDAALTSLAAASPSAKTTQECIEAFIKRDNSAVSMIYRLIRLTTDVLNTSAFSTTSTGGGEIPVDLTQSVMLCVKELKALKEYLLQTLEQITRDSGAFVLAQPSLAITRESVTERDSAIDFAFLLHRDFAAHIHKTLQDKCDVVTTTVHKLSESLATHAGDFSDAEAKCMGMEMQLAREAAEKATLEAKYTTQNDFVQRFVDERKRVEEALAKALADAKQERGELVAKMEMLEAEKCEAVALVRAHGIATTSSSSASTPRTPMSSNGRGYSSIVPTRPDKPRELTSSRLKTGMPSTTGTGHKERFVSDLERETGQRRTTNTHVGTTARRANEWKRHELLTSSTQIEQQFRAMNESSNFLAIAPESPVVPKERSLADQELWYQGVRMLQHVSFFVSVFFVPKQRTFRVEVFNSDSEQQQTIYVTLDEMQSFLSESKRALKNSLTLDDPARHNEVIEVLFERVKVLGGDSSNLLFTFQ